MGWQVLRFGTARSGSHVPSAPPLPAPPPPTALAVFPPHTCAMRAKVHRDDDIVRVRFRVHTASTASRAHGYGGGCSAAHRWAGRMRWRRSDHVIVDRLGDVGHAPRPAHSNSALDVSGAGGFAPQRTMIGSASAAIAECRPRETRSPRPGGAALKFSNLRDSTQSTPPNCGSADMSPISTIVRRRGELRNSKESIF